VVKYKKWYNVGNEPFANKKIMARMPSKIDPDYMNISGDMVDFIASECKIT